MKFLTSSALVAVSSAAFAATAVQSATAIQSIQSATAVVSASDALVATAAMSAHAATLSNVDSIVSEDLDTAVLTSGNSAVVAQAFSVISTMDPYKGSIYNDERGTICVGFGLNIDPKKNGGITEEQAHAAKKFYIDHFMRLLDKNAPWYQKLDSARKGAIVNMTFQMGIGNASKGTGLLGFKTAIAHMKAGRYQAAADAFKASAWYRGSGGRSQRIYRQIVTGKWQNLWRKDFTDGEFFANLSKQLLGDEGFKAAAYKDNRGFWTFGIGFMIDPKRGGTLPRNAAETLSKLKLAEIHKQFTTTYPWFKSLTPTRQAGLLIAAYKLSFKTFENFKKTIAFLEANKFEEAANEFLNSSFGKGVPVKARKIADMIKTGKAPAALQSSTGRARIVDEWGYSIPQIENDEEVDVAYYATAYEAAAAADDAAYLTAFADLSNDDDEQVVVATIAEEDATAIDEPSFLRF